MLRRSSFRVGSLLIALWIPLFSSALNAASHPIADGLKITIFDKGFPHGFPSEVAVAPDGALWFTDSRAPLKLGDIGRIASDGRLTNLYSTFPYAPLGITLGPDRAMWITMSIWPKDGPNDAIGRITSAGGLTEFPLKGRSVPGDIVTGPDGALWFPEVIGNKIGRMTVDGTLTEYSAGISSGCHPLGIAVGSDGALWFTEYWANRIGRITTGGAVTEYTTGIPSDEYPETIAAGPDGALWFTQFPSGGAGANSLLIGRITTAGVITEFPVPEGYYDWFGGITAGPGNAMWATSYLGGKLDRIAMDGKVAEFTEGQNHSGAIVAHQGGTLWFLLDGYTPGIARANL
jgi:virginiamycin B lyase